MLREPGPNREELLPILSRLIFWPLFLAELLNRYHGAHAESKRSFALAPKMASNPNNIGRASCREIV